MDESMKLFGDIVSRNVADATRTTNLLLDAKDDQVRTMAKALVRFGEVLDAATVIDRATEERLRFLYPHVDAAERLLAQMEESS